MFFKNTNQKKLTHKQLLKIKQHLKAAKFAIQKANLEEALKELQRLNNAAFEEQILMLLVRLNKHDQENRLGTLTNEENVIGFNRISRDILGLIKNIERGNKEISKINRELRDYLTERYGNRLEQKLGSHQPVNLRRFVSNEGTSELIASTFVPFNHLEIRDEIGKTFQDAYGRLLIVGQPGAGKTTLLLQLAQRLLELEEDALPIILNLATWESHYTKLETWLEEIVSAELSINKGSSKSIVNQTGLILLLDGLDELKETEAMASCLAAIAEYGAVAGRRFVITSRIEEYKQVQGDARVNLQIEVGPLSLQQLEAELESMSYIEPEAKLMLLTIRKDSLLQKIIEIPFYFNTLQLLSASNIPLFKANNIKDLQEEIKKAFIELSLKKNELYQSKHCINWLAFIAKRMNEQNKVLLELRDIQYSWRRYWPWSTRLMAHFYSGLVFGLRFGLFFGLILGFILGIILGPLGVIIMLLLGVVIGVVSAFIICIILTLRSKPISEIETNDYSRNLIIIMHLVYYKKLYAIVFFILIMLFLAFAVLISNYIFIVMTNTLTLIIVLGLMLGIVVGVFYLLTFGGENLRKRYGFIKINSPYQRFSASFISFHFSIIRHLHLRFLLYRQGLLPLRLVIFLNEMVKQKLMESDGATWRFRHRIIQDYFADLWIEPTPKNKKGRLQDVSAPKNT